MIVLLLAFAFASGSTSGEEIQCSTKWLTGYRLAHAQPQKTLVNLSLRECEEECVGQTGCGAFAYGSLPPVNRTCELAISSTRISRSVNVTMENVDKSPPWDVYVMRKQHQCQNNKRDYLFNEGRDRNSNNNVPIDCFYRLLSGKRLTKPHSLKAISVNSLHECQDACIRELGFQCRSVSYRYMPSGYSYSVSNCELSPFFIMTNQPAASNNHDFVDDFDYDYFQREPYCKTTGGNSATSGASSLGVCAVVIRRNGRLTPSLVKSSHQVTTPSQCEHLCTTALFRCRAFAFRHTDRGRDYNNRQQSLLSPCQLYEVELERLPSYNVESDPDYDLYEMGRLLGGDCMLQGQFHAKNRPVTSPLPFESHYGHHQSQSQHMSGGGGGYYERPQDREGDRYGYRPGNDDKSLLPGDRTNFFEDKHNDKSFPRPPGSSSISSGEKSSSSDHYDSDRMQYVNGRQPLPIQQDNKKSHYDEGTSGNGHREGCLIKHRPDAYLAPEVSRATFPVKTLEECRQECLRSMEVLRFPCRVMSFRLTSAQGGTCQLSETPPNTLRNQDFIPSTSNYRESGGVFAYDDNAAGCYRNYENNNRREDNYNDNRYANRGSYDKNKYGSGSNYGSYGSTSSNYGSSYPNYGSSNAGSSYPNYSNYGTSSRGNYWDRNYTPSTYPSQSSSSSYGGTGNGFYTQNYGSSYNRPSSSYDRYNERDRYNDNRDRYNERDRYNGRDRYNDQYPPQNEPQQLGRLTVDGERCLHSCVRNKEAGFYYCQTDQEGSWNFCCRPDDQGGQCGYSKGLSFSWCYVGTGPSRDIWRTCKRSSIPHHVQYLHDKQPPTVLKLNGEKPIGNLTLGDAVDLLDNKVVNETSLSLSGGGGNGTDKS